MLRDVDVPELIGQELAEHSSRHPGLFGRVEVGSVQSDPVMLRRMLEGLILQATRTAPEDGRITVHVRKTGGEVLFRVSHPGPAPEPAEPELRLAADLARALGGRLGIESAPATVWFALPTA